MITRKDFLKKTSLTALAGLSMPAVEKIHLSAASASPAADDVLQPLVIATWDNRKATDAAMKKMIESGSVLDAVETGVRLTEDDPEDTSVGYGGFPDRDGVVTLDACIMDEEGNAGAVACLQHIRHPVSVARKVMEHTPHVMLSGNGALQFALTHGFVKENLLTEKSKFAWQEWLKRNDYKPVISDKNHDTIGILALNSKGDMAGACSTSGWAFKMHGRVGDSPVIGAGLYVDNEVGAACATGLGEYVMKTLGTFLIVELMRNGSTPQEAVEEAIDRIIKKYNKTDMQVAFLAINKKGQHGSYSITPGFSYALYQGEENEKREAPSFIK